MDGVKASLKRLQLDHIDLYQIHGFDPVTPIEETLRALDDLVQPGPCPLRRRLQLGRLADHEGARHRRAAGLARASRSLQAYYTIAGRDLEREMVPLLHERRLGLMVWSPLAGGLLSGKYRPRGQQAEGRRRAKLRLPAGDKDRALRLHRRDAGDRRGARRVGGADRARLAAAPAVGDAA